MEDIAEIISRKQFRLYRAGMTSAILNSFSRDRYSKPEANRNSTNFPPNSTNIALLKLIEAEFLVRMKFFYVQSARYLLVALPRRV